MGGHDQHKGWGPYKLIFPLEHVSLLGSDLLRLHQKCDSKDL